MLRRTDSNRRPAGYEPAELPLLYRALFLGYDVNVFLAPSALVAGHGTMEHAVYLDQLLAAYRTVGHVVARFVVVLFLAESGVDFHCCYSRYAQSYIYFPENQNI